MIRKLIIGIILLLGITQFAPARADVYVNGYLKSNGSYVQPYWRSSPDNSISNNWSTQGNMNPYTGALGTKSPYDFGPSVSLPMYAPVFPSFTTPYFPLPAYTPPVFPDVNLGIRAPTVPNPFPNYQERAPFPYPDLPGFKWVPNPFGLPSGGLPDLTPVPIK